MSDGGGWARAETALGSKVPTLGASLSEDRTPPPTSPCSRSAQRPLDAGAGRRCSRATRRWATRAGIQIGCAWRASAYGPISRPRPCRTSRVPTRRPGRRGRPPGRRGSRAWAGSASAACGASGSSLIFSTCPGSPRRPASVVGPRARGERTDRRMRACGRAGPMSV